MLQLSVKIFQLTPGGFWTIQVNAVRPNGPPYFFQKSDFVNSQEAKTFFIENARLWALHMGVS